MNTIAILKCIQFTSVSSVTTHYGIMWFGNNYFKIILCSKNLIKFVAKKKARK